MRQWLQAALVGMSLSDDALGYTIGRGVCEERAVEMGLVEWGGDVEPPPDEKFLETFGKRLERLRGRLVCPLLNPRGRLIGVEVRAWQGEKRISQYMLPEASWNPVFVGLTPAAMRRVWDGGNVWITEGMFDMGPMEHIIPSQDVALATLRARVSDRHAAFLRRFCRGYVNLVYDNDETGRNQTHGYHDPKTGRQVWGALQTLQRVGVRSRDVPYKGKDPGAVWDRGGVDALRLAFIGPILGSSHGD